MLSKRRAFTLIELLVVVLIIAILAAVAVPQYKKAVEKSSALEAKSMIKTMQKSIDLYRVANGIPADKFLYFSGPRANAPFDIDVFKGMDCQSSSLNAYHACMSKNFVYVAVCNPPEGNGRCNVISWLLMVPGTFNGSGSGNKTMYYYSYSTQEGVWRTSCELKSSRYKWLCDLLLKD